MDSRDDDVQALDDLRWEQERSASLRTFAVVMRDGTSRHVLAHFWHNDNPAGHFNFFVVERSGRQLIKKSIPGWAVMELTEVTPPDVAAEVDRIAHRVEMRRQQGQAAFDQTGRKKISKSVH